MKEFSADIFNKRNENEDVTGGHFNSLGVSIEWQEGPTKDEEGFDIAPNGAFVETIIFAALQRLEAFQTTRFSCRENALAITKLEEAIHWMNSRTMKRISRGVEGQYKV